MANENVITIPDIGGAESVDVIEVFVAKGDKIKKDDSLITLESEKASMEIPAPKAGVVKAVKLSVGDKAAEGDVIVELLADSSETADASNDAAIAESETAQVEESTAKPGKQATEKSTEQQTEQSEVKSAETKTSPTINIIVPDIGGADDVDIIEVLVAKGDTVAEGDSLITLESEKASMEVPSSHAGVVQDIKVKVGGKISEGGLILTLISDAASSKPAVPEQKAPETQTAAPQAPAKSQATPVQSAPQVTATAANTHASPVVRRLAREFGVDLTQVTGSGRKSRILKEDVQAYVKSRLASGGAQGLAVPPAPVIDFSKFGDIEVLKLKKIKRLTGVHVHRSWVTIPHVTQFDEADITELEAFRKSNKKQAEEQGFKLTPLVFIMKAVVSCLKQFPTFNASLDPSGENLILKKYFHIGVAADTPNGLVVPVIRDVDQKGFFELAKELAEISKKARDKGLMPQEMQGSCFTISSLGGISGTAFTPIVNMPDVAILGVSKSKIQPVYIDGEFVPRLMLPLSLSYDHRVIDGAEAARFTAFLGACLSDLRKLLL